MSDTNTSTNLVVESRVRTLVSDLGFRVGGDFVEELSKCVENLVKTAVRRAEGRGAKTVGANDL